MSQETVFSYSGSLSSHLDCVGIDVQDSETSGAREEKEKGKGKGERANSESLSGLMDTLWCEGEATLSARTGAPFHLTKHRDTRVEANTHLENIGVS